VPSAAASKRRRGGWIHLFEVAGRGGRNAATLSPGRINPCPHRSGRIHPVAVIGADSLRSAVIPAHNSRASAASRPGGHNPDARLARAAVNRPVAARPETSRPSRPRLHVVRQNPVRQRPSVGRCERDPKVVAAARPTRRNRGPNPRWQRPTTLQTLTACSVVLPSATPGNRRSGCVGKASAARLKSEVFFTKDCFAGNRRHAVLLVALFSRCKLRCTRILCKWVEVGRRSLSFSCYGSDFRAFPTETLRVDL
jgi:hypothetical protein